MKTLRTLLPGILLAFVLGPATMSSAAAAPAADDNLEYFPASAAAPFSRAVRVDHTLYLSGQIGARPDGTLPADFDEQARQVMDNIAATLKSFGLGMDRVAKCTVMMADMSNWQRFNAIYVTYFQPGHLPARSAFGASGLAMGAALEVECIAALPEKK